MLSETNKQTNKQTTQFLIWLVALLEIDTTTLITQEFIIQFISVERCMLVSELL